MKLNKILSVVAIFFAITSSAFASAPQSVQVFSSKNSDGKITPKTIGAAFEANGLKMGGNNNMNTPFELRFKKTYYKTYHLAMFRNNELSIKLVRKYPHFGRLVPLTMSIWSEGDTMNVSTLTLEGIARTAKLPATDPDLIAYSKMIEKALKAAMPNGKFKKLNHKVLDPKATYEINFTSELDEDADGDEWRDNFEMEFEGEMEPIGFLFPNYTNMNEELFEEAGIDDFDFYITYSICKFDVIFPVSKETPEAGAYAPCSMYAYKKKGENMVHIGYLGVDNWIKTLDIKDEHAKKQLYDAQGMINNILSELTE
ncbi:DUF302 domain-containing protein [Sulfurimonas lithotrophica]|uniref:DUF302 domain-containing protein n=1 Tax=Sulfurimonas lithotrophica TaxID=2590022 RepID=A0A5P8NXV6_9BACT|nr:DUF302 domain-containing protein [Sulfurimonas lithotrophica]QFR48262.1 DUF302 domain-containing protein [Sulfurimonas lithotrophica]